MEYPDIRFLQDSRTVQVNRTEMSPVLDVKIQEKDCTQSLNGSWQVAFFENPSQIDQDFYQSSNSYQHFFSPVEIPEAAPASDRSNQAESEQCPWDGIEEVQQGSCPQTCNPCVIYSRHFDLDPDLQGKKVYLNIDCTAGGFYLWLNDRLIGYSENTSTVPSFEITPWLKDKDNTITLQLVQFSSGSVLEIPSSFIKGNSIQNIWLQARASCHLESLRVETEFLEDWSSARILLHLQVQDASGWRITLIDPDENERITVTSQQEWVAFDLHDVQSWSAEQPCLYTLKIDVLQNDQVCETVRQRVGIRQVEIQDGIVWLNGQRLMLHGVVLEQTAFMGQEGPNKQALRESLLALKRMGVNAIRTRGVNNQEALYRLCDELGLYVISQVNLHTANHESHKEESVSVLEEAFPKNRMEWRDAILDRASSQVLRFANHPSIVFWSLGQDCGDGDLLLEEYALIRQLDRTRPIQYDDRIQDGKERQYSDIQSYEEKSPAELRELLSQETTKPVLINGYGSFTGNGNGNLFAYGELEQFQQFHGGFLRGDFVHGQSGITQTPMTQEIRFLFQPYKILLDDNGVNIFNNNLFVSTRNVEFVFEQKQNGKTLLSGRLRVDLEAQEYDHYPIDWIQTPLESVCVVKAVLIADTPWAKAGEVVAWSSQTIGEYQWMKASTEPLKKIQGKKRIGFYDDGFSCLFDEKGLCSLKLEGKEWLKNLPRPIFVHPWTDKEREASLDLDCACWFVASQFARVVKRELIESGNGAFNIVRYTYQLPNPLNITCTVSYTPAAPGVLGVDVLLEGGRHLPGLPLLGMEFELDPSLDKFEYNGNGPLENYKDRNKGALPDLYKQSVQDNMTLYDRPQECGNRTGVRWISLMDHSGAGLCFSQVKTPLEACVVPWRFEEIEQADDMDQLPPSRSTVVRIAGWQKGIGGEATDGQQKQELLNSAKTRSFSFIISGKHKFEQFQIHYSQMVEQTRLKASLEMETTQEEAGVEEDPELYADQKAENAASLEEESRSKKTEMPLSVAEHDVLESMDPEEDRQKEEEEQEEKVLSESEQS